MKMNPIAGKSGGTPSGASIRKVCVPHACTGTESQVRCSIHSVMRPIPRNFLYHPRINTQTSAFNNLYSDGLTRNRCFDDELRVTATVCGMGIPFHSAPAITKSQPVSTTFSKDYIPSENTTSYALYKHSLSPDHNSYQFNEYLRFPALWRDLPRDACIAFNVIGSNGNHLYGTTFQLFDTNGLLRTGLQKIVLHPNKEAVISAGVDSSISSFEDKTIGVSPNLLARREFYAGGRDYTFLPSNNPTTFTTTSKEVNSDEGYSPELELADSLWRACLIMDKLNGNNTKKTSPYGLKRRPSASSRSTIAGQLSTNNHVSVPWLDNLTMQRCTNILKGNDRNLEEDDYLSATPTYFPQMKNSSTTFSCPEAMLALSPFLIIELPTLPIPIVHEESCYPHPMNGSSGSITADELYFYHSKRISIQNLQKDSLKDANPVPSSTTLGTDATISTPNSTISKYTIDKGIDETDIGLALVQIVDHENEDDNPVEDKYRTLAHDLIRGLVDPGLKPNREQRFRLDSIISSPSHHPTLEEKGTLAFMLSITESFAKLCILTSSTIILKSNDYLIRFTLEIPIYSR